MYLIYSRLFDPQHIGDLNDYFKDVKERLIPDEGSEYGYHFCGATVNRKRSALS